MRKVQVTRQYINKELNYDMYHTIVSNILLIAFQSILIALIIAAINICLDCKIPYELSLLLFLFLIYKIPSICLKYNEKKNSFVIRKDTVISRSTAKTGGRYSISQPYSLTFTYGRFDISARKYYNWSKIYTMNDKEIYDSTYLGDTFTLIEFKNEILVIFNDSFFDVQI